MPSKPPPKDRQHALDEDLACIRRHMRIMVDLGRLAADDGISEERFLAIAVVQVARAVEIDHVKLLRYRAATADLLIVAGIGWKDGVVGHVALPSDLRSPPGRAYQTAEPVSIKDTGDAVGFAIAPTLKEHGIVSLLNVPVLIDGAAWGVLEVDSTRPRSFSEDTATFMTAAAAVMGAAMQRRRVAAAEAQAQAAVAERALDREILLREMQHRVKNNFQLILASLTLQRRRFGHDGGAARALDHVANRINAIALAHDQLALREGGQAVEVAGYLRALGRSIEQQAEQVTIEVEADEVLLAVERAVALGLIMNEAITNSVKHAFGDKGGRVFVRLQAGVGYGEAKLTIADDGRGGDLDARAAESKGSGLKLMEALAGQAGGVLERSSSDTGTTVGVVVPVI